MIRLNLQRTLEFFVITYFLSHIIFGVHCLKEYSLRYTPLSLYIWFHLSEHPNYLLLTHQLSYVPYL